MRNAVRRLCSNNKRRGGNIIINSNNDKKNALKSLISLSSSSSSSSSYHLLEELQDRFRRLDGLSTTRKGVLLRDWQRFASVMRETSMDCSSTHALLSEDSSSSSLTAAALTAEVYSGRKNIGNHNRKGEELCRVLRIVSEFIASTGTCSDPTVPLPNGYADLSPMNGIRRATLVLNYTETVLLLSNDHMAALVALTFGRSHSTDTELTLEEEKEKEQSDSNTRCTLRWINEGDPTTRTATIEEDEDEEESDGAPLTSLETVALLRWCTWHVRTALCGFHKDDSLTMESFRTIVRLVSRFLTVLVDGGLRRGAVENITDEYALSDMAYIVMDELLNILNAKATDISHNDESSLSTPVDSLENTNTTISTSNNKSSSSNNNSNSGRDVDGDNDSGVSNIRDEKSISNVSRWSNLQIHEDAQHALLCSQREHWERALSLLIRVRSWNDSLIKKNKEKNDDNDNKKNKDMRSSTVLTHEILYTLVESPRTVLQTLQYILAQHGQWSVCMELWQETVRRRSVLETTYLSSSLSLSSSSSTQELSPFAALHHPFNVDNIVTALAFVNAKPFKAVVGSSEGDSLELPARLLRLLLYLGIVPNRTLSPAEFAALLKQSFGLSLGRGGVAGILSPAYVWRLAASHPHRARATLCLMCFHMVVRNGLTHTLELEDLYVVTCISRRFLQEQYRAAEATSSSVMIRCEDEEENDKKDENQQKNPNEDSIKSNSSNNNNNDDNTDEYEKNAFGPLPVYFAPATRRSTTATETHIVAITDAFLSMQQSIFPVQEEKDLNNHTHHLNPKRPGRSAVLLTLVSHELMALLTMAPYGRALERTWRAALAALPHDTNLTDDLHYDNRYYTYNHKHNYNYDNSNSGLAMRPSRSVAALAQALRRRALDPGGRPLIDPLVQLAPQLSAFAVGRIVHSPLGRQLTWRQCLLLLPCTPWGSRVQRHLLRRVVLEGGGDVEGLRGLMQVNGTLPPRWLHEAPTLAADMRVLTILTEHDWRRALTAYVESGERVRQACAPHVARLVISAGVWYTPRVPSTDLSSSSSSTTTTNSSSNSNSNNNTREDEVDHNGRALRLLFRVALRAVGGDRVAEEMLRGSLLRGRWAAGLAFHQFLQHDQPEMLRSNKKMELYVALLCKGLLSQTAMARAIAEVSRSARGAAWKEACETFLQYMTEGGMNGGNPNKRRSEGLITTVNKIQKEGEKTMDDDIPLSSGSWSSLFHVRVPSQLSHFAHTVRYSMICSEYWEQALRYFPIHSLPLPLHHQIQLQRFIGGILGNMESKEEKTDSQGNEGQEDGRVMPSSSASSSLTTIAGATTHSPSPLSLSLVQIALQDKLHRTKSPIVKTSAAAVERTLRVLQQRGQWEQAMLVYEHALANRCFPHTAGSIVLGACLPSWEASLYCFAHLSERMRPDAMTTALALQACARGQQWVLALRILKQSVLTTAVAAPRVIDYAVKAALNSGAWQAALCVARQYRGSSSSTSSPVLANTIMHVLVITKCWDDAVGFFYECIMRGMRPLDESLTLAIKASEAVSAEYRDAARVVSVIASALEDFFHVEGVVQEHVLVVYREISSKPHAGVDSHLILVSFARSVSSGSGNSNSDSSSDSDSGNSTNISENETDKLPRN
ncbi:uncharacterized protein TM35_000331980 [Trypanosoma theileri]|uniref:Uncharacterized protein n=1 Tax=Trypanosoma theileri TaxID=67003 RepID=A0A1X0NMD4_9TRYP|nr:uncharacterized protein TM35_000331980 [Trypanosoma theileri]ORC85741.1 hypothetical protein TM35_000331980 [Trypanosoma theileri]